MKVRKAVIPAAGLGTRFLPATKSQPKEMLPIVDKPTIQYIVEEAASAGIEDIIVVTGRNKRSIEDHFDRSIELELELDAENNWQITDARGFENYYSGYRRSLRRKLNSLNAPIGRQMDEIFKVKSFMVQHEGGDEYGFSQTLNIAIKADVKSDKPLAKILGNVILGKGDRESFAPFAIDMSQAEQGIQIFNVTKTLNPFIRADADAMKHGFKKNDISIEVTEIIFADGTNLKLLDSLPE